MTLKHLPNITFPTLGGQQFWQDEYFYAGWRVQKNAVTGHHRLLNPKDIRYAWGSFEACLKVLNRLKTSLGITNPSPHLILLVHGMAGWKENFFLMRRALRRKGYFAAGYNYLSLKDTLEKQAGNLNNFLNTIEGVNEITLIGHSQGGLVIRKALEADAPWQKNIKVRGLIFAGTPNKGAALADFSKRLKALDKVAPKVRDQLTISYAQNISVPNARIGLIAGVMNRGRGINPLIPGPDDGVVGVDEVWIDGQDDCLVVASDHFSLTSRKKTIAAVLQFLQGKPLAG